MQPKTPTRPRIDPLVPFDDWHIGQAQGLMRFDDPEPEVGWIRSRQFPQLGPLHTMPEIWSAMWAILEAKVKPKPWLMPPR